MKAKLIIFILLITANLYAIDSTVFKMLPLKVGNIWVYKTSTWINPGNQKSRVRITGSEIINGHIYYTSDVTHYGSVCISDYFYFGILGSGNKYRIDSLTGNLYCLKISGCPQRPNDFMIDSLNSSSQDTLKFCNVLNYRYNCQLIDYINFWGSYRKWLDFGFSYGGLPNLTTAYRYYYENIGLYRAENGTYTIGCMDQLLGCVINGVVYGDTTFPIATGIIKISDQFPQFYSLSQNYPNPFNPSTTIKFALPPSPLERVGVRLTIYDILGREITTLVNEQLQPGEYSVTWSADNYPSGVYFYKIETKDFVDSKKMVLIK